MQDVLSSKVPEGLDRESKTPPSIDKIIQDANQKVAAEVAQSNQTQSEVMRRISVDVWTEMRKKAEEEAKNPERIQIALDTLQDKEKMARFIEDPDKNADIVLEVAIVSGLALERKQVLESATPKLNATKFKEQVSDLTESDHFAKARANADALNRQPSAESGKTISTEVNDGPYVVIQEALDHLDAFMQGKFQENAEAAGQFTPDQLIDKLNVLLQAAQKHLDLKRSAERSKMEKLKLHIGIQSKRVAEQVAQTTESDYFQNLAQKARQLREQNKK